MPGWDAEIMAPPSAAHRIHEALLEREEKAVVTEREAGRDPEVRRGADAALEARREGENAREEARRRVEARHGRPGQGQIVRPDQLQELPDHITRRVAVRGGRPLIFGGGSTIRMECPLCPGHEQSWALTHLGDVGEPVRSALRDADLGVNAPAGVLPAYCCSGCKERFFRSGLCSRSEWIEAHGGPPELVRQHQVRERMLEIRRERHSQGLPFSKAEAREQAEREIPPAGGDA
jgi:hypothetical protein